MEMPIPMKYFLIGGSVYLVTQYGCKAVNFVFRLVTRIISDKSAHNLYISQLHWSCISKPSLKDMQIHLVSIEEESNELVQELRQRGTTDGFLGFDCEWVNGKPVALVQLSATDGFCVMFHLSKMQSFPSTLRDLLEDSTILKVGVSIQNDAKLLLRDYQVQTLGCIDIRFFAPIRDKMGLSALASDHLNITLDKSSHIRRSDWSATLTEEQLQYAGQDAYVGALLFAKLMALKMKEVVSPYIGINFKGSHNIDNKNSSQRRTDKVRDKNTCSSGQDLAEIKAVRAYTPRRTPMYSNCKMLAPDGEVLCTCSRKKADWYLSQGLAKEICVEPYTIQLLFEPASRFRGPSGLYYVQDKVNQCVTCGKKDSHLRKNVVPHEYRRHFPDAMKKHQSHDVLPLCRLCHLRSNSADISLRQKLAVECNALIGVGNDVKATDDGRLKKLRSAARALLHGGNLISEKRREKLVNVIKEELPYYEEQLKHRNREGRNADEPQEYANGDEPHEKGNGEESHEKGNGDEPHENGNGDNRGNGAGDTQSLQNLPLEELLPNLRDIDVRIANDNYIPHGLKVTEHFAQDGIPGLIRLEKMWREHFLETMKPRFLPDLWSVSHFHRNEGILAEDAAFQTKMQKIKFMEDHS